MLYEPEAKNRTRGGKQYLDIAMYRFVTSAIFRSIAFTGMLLIFANSHAEESNPDLNVGAPSKNKAAALIPVYTYELVNTYPHDSNAYTQGLVFQDGVLYEGTGLRGHSSLRRVELETGDILKILRLPNHIFGEGIAVYKDNIIQLTWKSKVGLVYDKNSFVFIQNFSYATQGWGITSDGEKLIMSDGSSIIRFLDHETYKLIDQIQVRCGQGPVENLNELEYVKGEIYANVWQTERIVMIAPDTGKVTGWIDLRGLLVQEGPAKPVDVLNGIAYDSEKDRLFVTGKLWPKLFEIKLKLKEEPS